MIGKGGFQYHFDDGSTLTQVWAGLEDDDSPILTIRTACSCGRFAIERTYDVSLPAYRISDPFEDSSHDAAAYLQHFARGHDPV